MSANDSVFNNLRQKLDVFGYKQALPLAAIPLVGAIFEDLVKTTESLRDAKKKIVLLLEEKNCWELGVEPYKCDNSRLLSECSQLHLITLRQQEDFEKRVCEYNQKIRNLQSDKFHLEEQCTQLQQQIQKLIAKQSENLGMGKYALFKTKKPFISTVRSGDELPPLQPLSEQTSNIRCGKCNASGCTQRAHMTNTMHESKNANCQEKEITKLENNVKDLTEQLAFYKRKVESRDREIARLNELLSGGRPASALAKDCCYKQVGALAQDIEVLQREKNENLNKLRSYQDQMHEAMQRALKLEAANRQLRTDLDEIKKAALQIEQQANADAAKRECEIERLKLEMKRSAQKTAKTEKQKVEHVQKPVQKNQPESNAERRLKTLEAEQMQNAAEKRRLKEQLNTITQREIELKTSNQALHKKMQKLKSKLVLLRKELKHTAEQNRNEHLDEEKIRLKSERDFFQKEYLRLVSKAGSEKEIEFLQEQVKSKDNELRILRTELCLRDEIYLPTNSNTTPATDYTAHQQRSNCPKQLYGNRLSNDAICSSSSCGDINRIGTAGTITGSVTANCVQAVLLRAERERDMARAELERVRSERDTLREKHVSMLQAHAEESQKVQQRCEELNARIRDLERENREVNSARAPSETQIVLLKEEIDDVRRRLCAAQEENCMLKTAHSQLKILHEQTERSLLEYQNKLTLAEHQLETADLRLNTLDSNRETVRTETTQLRSEINALRHTYVALEHEKDAILAQLDIKTQRVCELELELQSCREKRDSFEQRANELGDKFSKLNRENHEKCKELYQTTTELKLLRQQIEALKKSRDEAINENGGLVDNCSDIKAMNFQLKKDLENQNQENEALKKKICQYVQEIRKTEELLLRKEREREEMLEQYRSLSQDTVALQGNNLSLEEEAAEYKRQVADYEQEICELKTEIRHRNEIIDEMESKIAVLSEHNLGLQHRLDEIQEEKHLLKLDLSSRTELCTRLEDERAKLNAEIEELNNALRDAQTEKENKISSTRRLERTAESSEETPNPLESTLQLTRLDLENQLRLGSRLNEELLRLRRQNESLMEDLEAAHRKNMHSEKLIHEYFVQNQELRHNLTDDRFRQARARQQQQKEKGQTSSSLRFSKEQPFSSLRQQSPGISNSLALHQSIPNRTLSEEGSAHSDSSTRIATAQCIDTEVDSDAKDDEGSYGDSMRRKHSSKEKRFPPYHSKTM